MRLTKEDKASFVINVMRDVPSEDYGELSVKVVRADAESQLPAAVAALLKTHPEYLRIDAYCHRIQDNYPRERASFIGVSGFRLSPEAKVKFDSILERKVKREELSIRVASMIASCSTLKQATENLPEFEKYLPAERTEMKNLPAISNTVAELVKAGWPK